MSQLEGEAKPLLTPLLEGRGREFHQTGQRVLAAWALKTAMTFEHTQGQDRHIIGQPEYVHLRRHLEPSCRVRVWMSTYAGQHVALNHIMGADADVDLDAARGEREIFSSTVVLGPAVFHLFGSSVPGLAESVELTWPGQVFPLWPYVGSFVCNPRSGMDDGALTSLAEGVIRDLVRRYGLAE